MLVGHSLGAVTALALPGWARTVVLEEPPTAIPPEVSRFIADSLEVDRVAVREDRDGFRRRLRSSAEGWADEDVHARGGGCRIRGAPVALFITGGNSACKRL